MIIELHTTPVEKKRLQGIAEAVLNPGHWGNAAVEIPEEQLLLKKIQNADNGIELSLRELELLLSWMNTITGYGTFLLSEDVILLNRVHQALLGTIDIHEKDGAPDTARMRKTLGIITELIRHIPSDADHDHPSSG